MRWMAYAMLPGSGCACGEGGLTVRRARPRGEVFAFVAVAAIVGTLVPGAVRAIRNGSPVAAIPPPAAAWGPVSRVIGHDDPAYAVLRAGTGFAVRNGRQGLTAGFSAAGVTVRSGGLVLGVRLVGYGYGNSLPAVPPAAPSAQANRIVYSYGSLSEWYANGPAGLEQGFTLRNQPTGDRGGLVTVGLALSGDALAVVSSDRQVVTFSHGVSSLAYRGLLATDARGRRLTGWLALRGRELLLEVDDAGSRYPLTIDPFVQQAKLVASDGAASDFLGNSVAIWGNTLVAGAPNATVDGNRDNGAVYVFVKPSWAGWQDATEKTKLIASNNEANDSLGTSVAIQGDTVIAGAPNYITTPGAADVFVEPPGGWPNGTETQTAQISEPNGVNGDGFGAALAIQGNALFVGAPYANGSGAVYVFEPAGFNGWQNVTETAEMTGAPGDCLGLAMAVQFDTLVAGAPCATVGANQSQGATYVFTKPWWADWRDTAQSATLTESNGAAGDFFGNSVAVQGNTLAVGAPFASANDGLVDVFVKARDGWSTGEAPTATLTTPDLPDGGLGLAVAFQDDTVVAGAPFLTLPNVPGITFEGSVFLFDRPPSGWSNETETAGLLGSDIDDVGWLGYSLAIQNNTIVAGAPLSTDGNNPVQGAAYVFASSAPGFAPHTPNGVPAGRAQRADVRAPQLSCAPTLTLNEPAGRVAAPARMRKANFVFATLAKKDTPC
jgi:trimeric autotransporter adhesin